MRSIYSKIKQTVVFTPMGERYEEVRSLLVDDCGRRSLVKTGVVDRVAEADSYAPFTDKQYILGALARGDTSMLFKNEPFYGDVTTLPKDLREALQLKQNALKAFNGLSSEIKKSFNNDFESWLSSSGSESWLSKMGVLNDKAKNPVPSGSEVPASSAQGAESV